MPLRRLVQFAAMVEPRVIPRAEHTLSRRDVDPDALKVLYRLRQSEYAAYLVGGSVRDLLLGRRPKDFDIGTSAHPYQVKKLFRNCWIIGRRFRLAHVKFGTKVIEVATFRRQVQPGEEVVQDGIPAPDPSTPEGAALIHHDNTFGTPEEDAFRRDFTINALFYDIATFSIIDYVGGLEDLRAGVVRSIGDPGVRFHEDPVRIGSGTPIRDDQLHDEVRVWDLWLPRDKLLITVVDEQELPPLQIVEWDGPERGPYHLCAYQKVPGNIMPVPSLYGWADLHVIVNQLCRKLGRQAERQRTVLGYQDGAGDDATRLLHTEDGEGVKMSNPEAVKEFRLGGADQATLAVMLQFRQLVSMMAGSE